MKSNPAIESLQSNLAHRVDRVNEITSLQNSIGSTGDLLKQLEETADITSKPIMDQIIQLQAMSAMLPRRIAALEKALNDFDQKLTQKVHDCISQVISPRAQQLAVRTRANVKATLRSLYSDSAALDAAVHNSDQVRTLTGIAPSITNPEHRGGIVNYAQSLLDVWNNLDAIEAKLA